MRVLIVSALPPERSSYIGRIFPLASALARARHSVTLLTLSGERAESLVRAETRDGVSVHLVGPNLRASDETSPSSRRTLRRFLDGRRALRAALARQRPDVLILAKPQLQNTAPTIAYARGRGIPLVLDTDDLEAAASRLPLFLRWYAAHLERRAARVADIITACSPFLVERARAQNPRARVEFLPTGMTIPTTLPRLNLRERVGVPADARIILYVGSLSIASGHRVDRLLRAFGHLRKHDQGLHLVLAGSGVDADRLREQVQRAPSLRDVVHFFGRFSPPEDFALAAEADVLVDPVDRAPVTEAKSSHRALLGLATGTPVVTGNVGIRRLLLPTALHAEFLYDPRYAGNLKNALQRALAPGARDRFRAATEGSSTQWTWDHVGPQFVALVESLSPKR